MSKININILYLKKFFLFNFFKEKILISIKLLY